MTASQTSVRFGIFFCAILIQGKTSGGNPADQRRSFSADKGRMPLKRHRTDRMETVVLSDPVAMNAALPAGSRARGGAVREASPDPTGEIAPRTALSGVENSRGASRLEKRRIRWPTSVPILATCNAA
jgi:hypothetical protein